MTSDQTPDDFDLNDLKAAMTEATPRPDPAVRAAHLRLAQENFDRLQETAQAARPTSQSAPTGLIGKVTTMLTTLTTRGGLTATTALAAVALLVVTPQGRSLWERPGETMADNIETELGTAVPSIDFGGTPQATVESPANDSGTALERTAVPSIGPAPEAMAEAPMVEADSFSADIAVEAVIAPAPPAEPVIAQAPDTEAFPEATPSAVQITSETPVSTFSIDVDTASYGIVRQSLTSGRFPAPQAVRIEEMINYFPYDYMGPTEDSPAPFQPHITVMDTPWNPGTQLLHIGLQGEMPAIEARPPLNLVFLIDTSGSMNNPDKLPLLIQSFRLMLDNLRPEDQVAIVTYAGSAGLALPSTSAADRTTILAALNSLQAGGGTNGQGGLQQAYDVAQSMASEGEVSRVILATDGDFNVGVSSVDGLTDYIADQRDTGVFLSVLGFGRGNLDDATMQALAQNGNGTASYIDTLSEAQKVLVDQLTGALFTIASDVKVQIEFNPAIVAEYRLIGYETRALAREDFNNDTVDAGELGAGHAVTAIYEITPVGSDAVLNDDLRYAPDAGAADAALQEIGFLRLRWKEPGTDASQLFEVPIPTGVTEAGPEASFAAAIAGFGQLLQGSDYLGDWGYPEAIALALQGRGDDPFGYRAEAIQLMRLADSLSR